MAIMRIPLQIKTENDPGYFSSKMKDFYIFHMKLITCIPHNPTGQTIIEKANHTLKEMLNKQKNPQRNIA